MTKLEEIARVLCAGDPNLPTAGVKIYTGPDGSTVGIMDWENTVPQWRLRLADARAAVEAMREPPRGAVLPMYNATAADQRALWQAMIDAILNEPEASC